MIISLIQSLTPSEQFRQTPERRQQTSEILPDLSTNRRILAVWFLKLEDGNVFLLLEISVDVDVK